MKLSGSDSELRFAVFNSTGNLLQGDRRFESVECSEIAKKCDRTECSLYCMADSTGTLILGRRFLVRVTGGREERVSVVAEYTGDDIAGVFEIFYDGARNAVENLEDRSYQVIGIWEEGDLSDHEDPRSPSRKTDSRFPRKPASSAMMSLYAGKIIANEEVTVQLPAIEGLALIHDIFPALMTHCRLKIPFSCALAKYPPETDLWITPDEAEQGKGGPDDGSYGVEYFKALYRYIERGAVIRATDRDSFAREAKSGFLKDETVSNIIGYFSGRCDPLLRLYLHDPAALKKLLQDIHPGRLSTLSEEVSLGTLRALASGGRRGSSMLSPTHPGDPVGISSAGTNSRIYSMSDLLNLEDPVVKHAPALIKRLSESNRHKAREILIENGYFVKPVVEELVSDALKYGSSNGIELLSRMTLASGSEQESFAAITRKAVSRLDFELVVERIKAFLQWDGKRSEAMNTVFRELRNKAERDGDLYRALTRAERRGILDWTGKEVWKKSQVSRYRKILTPRVILVLVVVVIAVTAILVFLVLYMEIDVAGYLSQFIPSWMAGAVEGASDLASLPPETGGV